MTQSNPQNTWGGKRENSRPKPNTQLQHARDLIDQATTGTDGVTDWNAITELIATTTTNPRAATSAMRRLSESRGGKPTAATASKTTEPTATAPTAAITPANPNITTSPTNTPSRWDLSFLTMHPLSFVKHPSRAQCYDVFYRCDVFYRRILSHLVNTTVHVLGFSPIIPQPLAAYPHSHTADLNLKKLD